MEEKAPRISDLDVLRSVNQLIKEQGVQASKVTVDRGAYCKLKASAAKGGAAARIYGKTNEKKTLRQA